MTYFLLFHNRRTGHTTHESFASGKRANEAYCAAEREHAHDPNLEIVLLGARSLDDLRVTHGNYFEGSQHEPIKIIRVTPEQFEALLDRIENPPPVSERLRAIARARYGDPVARAPYDDEPYTEEDRRDTMEARASIARGEGIPTEEVRARLEGRCPDADDEGPSEGPDEGDDTKT